MSQDVLLGADPPLEGLAKRLLDCRKFKWCPGMRSGLMGTRFDMGDNWNRSKRKHWPVLTDKATLGALLYLIRGLKEDPGWCPRFSYDEYDQESWVLWNEKKYERIGTYKSEAEVLVAALEDLSQNMT